MGCASACILGLANDSSFVLVALVSFHVVENAVKLLVAISLESKDLDVNRRV